MKKEFLIVLLELFSYRSSRVWEELENINFKFSEDMMSPDNLKKIIKDKRKHTYFSIDEINNAINRSKKIINYCSNNKFPINIIDFEDEKYPSNYFNGIPISERPVVLYTMGNSDLLKKDSIAMIGSRQTDSDYSDHAVKLSKNLSKKYVIISGLAVGSDTAAHQGALDNGNTIAILANGLDKIYPAENKQLANDIYSNGGLLISEYPPYSKTQRYFFAQRDRLQAALSRAIIVIETGIKSGTMITIDYARKYKKKVLILEPFNNSKKYNDEGNNLLLRDQKYEILSSNKLTIEEIEPLINDEKKDYIVFEIVDKVNFKIYKLKNKEFTKIPKNYKEIYRDNNKVVTELISDD